MPLCPSLQAQIHERHVGGFRTGHRPQEPVVEVNLVQQTRRRVATDCRPSALQPTATEPSSSPQTSGSRRQPSAGCARHGHPGREPPLGDARQRAKGIRVRGELCCIKSNSLGADGTPGSLQPSHVDGWVAIGPTGERLWIEVFDDRSVTHFAAPRAVRCLLGSMCPLTLLFVQHDLLKARFNTAAIALLKADGGKDFL